MPIELKHEEEKKAAITIPDEELVSEYYEYRQQLDQMRADCREVITHPSYCIPFLQVGRLVKISYKNLDFGWGVIVNCQKRMAAKVGMHSYLRANINVWLIGWYRIGPCQTKISRHMTDTF